MNTMLPATYSIPFTPFCQVKEIKISLKTHLSYTFSFLFNNQYFCHAFSRICILHSFTNGSSPAAESASHWVQSLVFVMETLQLMYRYTKTRLYSEGTVKLFKLGVMGSSHVQGQGFFYNKNKENICDLSNNDKIVIYSI